jgi:DNA-binding MarR family transcriptional regulator
VRQDEQDKQQEAAGLALFELAPRLTRLENAVLRDVTPPLTFRQYRILQRVAQGRTTLTALGRLATISLPAVSESVEGLVRKGLLRRRVDADDRRAVNLQLTKSGQRALDTAERLLVEAAQRLLDGVPVRRRVALEADVRRITERVTRALLDELDAPD